MPYNIFLETREYLKLKWKIEIFYELLIVQS